MQETGNDNLGLLRQRLTIRVSNKTISFSTVAFNNVEQPVTFEPYPVKSRISIAANMREALKTATLPTQGYRTAQVMVESPVLMVPVEMFKEEECDALYKHSFDGIEHARILYNVLPYLNCVAVFPINKDLKMVIDEHFQSVSYIAALAPVWRYLHRRSFTGTRHKLYVYFHDGKADIFSYNQTRFKYCNQFRVQRANDAVYFILYAWKQLGLRPLHDEMHIVGTMPEKDVLLEKLKKYLQRVYVINPSGDFNRAAATKIENMPYDMMTLYIKGR